MITRKNTATNNFEKFLNVQKKKITKDPILGIFP